MAYREVNDNSLASVANAIRSKGGTSDALVFPDGFVSAVQAIATGGVSRMTFTPAENTQSVEVPFNKVFGLFCVVVYCSDIAGSADVSRIKQFSGQKLPFSGKYTGRIDVINADGAEDYWSQASTVMTGTTIKFETTRPCYFEAGKTYKAEIFEVTV